MMFSQSASTCSLAGASAGAAACYSAPQAFLVDNYQLTMHSSSTTSLQTASALVTNSYGSQDPVWYECFSTISYLNAGSTRTSGSAVDKWAYAFVGINSGRYYMMDTGNGLWCGNTGDHYLSTYVNRTFGDLTYNIDYQNNGGSCYGVNRNAYTTVPLKTTTYNATHVVRTVSAMENWMNNFLCGGNSSTYVAGCSCTLVYVAACYPGTYSNTGSSASGACTACPAGSISGVGATSCTPCSIGTYTTDSITCLTCPASTFSGAGASSCTPFATLLNLLNNITTSLSSLQVNVSSTAATCAAASAG